MTTRILSALVFGIVAIGIALGIVQHNAVNEYQTGAKSGTEHVVVRGYPGDWYEFDYPSDWFAYPGNDQRTVQTFPRDSPPLSTTAWAKLDISDEATVSDDWDEQWPAGTVTDTISLERGLVTRYRLPLHAREKSGVQGVHSDSLTAFEIDPHAGTGAANDRRTPFNASLHVVSAPDQTTHDELRALGSGIIASIEFIDNYQESLASSYPTQFNAQGTSLFYKYQLDFPTGWSITDNGSSIFASGVPGPAYVDTISIEFEPGQPRSLFHDAEWYMRGDHRIRYGPTAPVTQGGVVTSTYVLSNGGNKPVLATVVAPELTEGTDAYWTYEQVIWRVLYSLYVWYSEAYP